MDVGKLCIHAALCEEKKNPSASFSNIKLPNLVLRSLV